MTILEIPLSTSWSDRFYQADLETLLQELGQDLRVPFEMVRNELTSRGLTEELCWNGPTYKWSLAYRSPKAKKTEYYLVPRPTQPILAAPVKIERLAEIKTSKLDRLFRERIIAASIVGPNAWCTWPIGSKTSATAIIGGIRQIWGHPA